MAQVTDEQALPISAEEFLTWLAVERGRSPNTLSAYRGDLRRYWRFLGARSITDLDAVTESDLEAFGAALAHEGLAPASVARSLVTVRSLHRFCAAEELTSGDPGAELELPRVRAGLPKPLSEAEIERLLAAAGGEAPIDRRDLAALELLYSTGARISEVAGLHLDALDLGARLVRLLGKGSKERIVPLGEPAAEAVARWLELGRPAFVPSRWRSRADAEAVFLGRGGRRLTRSGLWRRIRRLALASGLGERVTPHTLRHSCATHMVDHGADIRTVQELLGHASISTTQVYTKVSTRRLREIYDAAHPRARQQ